MTTVFLVDDDASFIYAVSRSLRAHGFEVSAHESGLKMIDELDSGAAIDVLVTDLRLGFGSPHGVSLARMARRRHKGLPVIFLTAYPELVGHIGQEASEILIKPVEPQNLKSAIDRALAPSGPA